MKDDKVGQAGHVHDLDVFFVGLKADEGKHGVLRNRRMLGHSIMSQSECRAVQGYRVIGCCSAFGPCPGARDPTLNVSYWSERIGDMPTRQACGPKTRLGVSWV